MQESLLRRGRFRRISSVLVFQSTCRSVFHCVLLARHVSKDTRRHQHNILFDWNMLIILVRTDQWNQSVPRLPCCVWTNSYRLNWTNKSTKIPRGITELHEIKHSTGKVCACIIMPSTRSHQPPLQRNSHQASLSALLVWTKGPRTWQPIISLTKIISYHDWSIKAPRAILHLSEPSASNSQSYHVKQ